MSRKARFGMSNQLPPKKCPDCKKILPEPKYTKPFGPYIIQCSCGMYLQWSWPNCWKRHHRAGPLFDDGRTIATA